MSRILFSGYAPVHFLCFLPVYEELVRDARLEIMLSGGFRTKTPTGCTYTMNGFYEPYGIDRSAVMPIEQARQEDFDVVVCAHLSDDLFPRSAGASVQVFHGVSFKNLAVREKALRYDLLCLPGRYHAEAYARANLVRPGQSRCLITGFPKADAIVAPLREPDPTLAAIGMDPARPTILFAPTGEKHNALEVMGEQVIRNLRDNASWNVLIKPHDHPKNDIDWFAELRELECDRVRLVRDTDVIPFLRAADLLMTDASSVAVEYTLLDRPIVFLDSPGLFKRVEKRAPAFDIETYGRKIGTVVTRPETVESVVAECLSHPERHADLRRRMARHVFHDPGHAVHRVANVIRYAAGIESSLPDDVETLEPPSGGSTCLSAA